MNCCRGFGLVLCFAVFSSVAMHPQSGSSLTNLEAQEIRYIELSYAEQRTQLRHPPPQGYCSDWTCGGSGGGSVVDAAPEKPDRGALAVYLLRVSPTEIDPREPFEAEFKIVNAGPVGIELPVSPHLSDLQPSDESLDFHYFSLTLFARIQPEAQGPDVGGDGYIALYGSSEHEGSMLELRPGESIRVKANMKLHTWPLRPAFARFRGEFWLRRNVFHPKPGGGFTETQNLHPNETPTPSIAVHLLGSARTEKPK
jgi:hypothetical protein